MNILIGAGGNAVDVLSFLFHNDICFIDDSKTGVFMGYEILGTINELINKEIKIPDYASIYNCLGSSGNNTNRNNVYNKIKKAGLQCYSIIMSNNISKNVKFGENLLINLGVQIHHDCYIGDNSVISPGAILCGNVTLKGNNYIGAGAVIKQGVTIGENAIIGMGAVVIHNVPDNETWVGNPAKNILQ